MLWLGTLSEGQIMKYSTVRERQSIKTGDVLVLDGDTYLAVALGNGYVCVDVSVGVGMVTNCSKSVWFQSGGNGKEYHKNVFRKVVS